MSWNINERSPSGATRLFEAVSSGSIIEVQNLLAQGADPNIPENNGTTPLMEAASGGSVPMIELLLRYGAKWDCHDHFGDTALDYARNQKRKAAVHFLEGLEN
jgi:uncharacterized protein